MHREDNELLNTLRKWAGLYNDGNIYILQGVEDREEGRSLIADVCTIQCT